MQTADVQRMTESLFIEGPWTSRGSSRFWVLLVLASVIATAGVVADPTATVIGAMIVAPLMAPILGSALAVVAAMLLVAVPLASGTASVARDEQLAAAARPISIAWATSAHWQITDVEAHSREIMVNALGVPTSTDVARLRQALDTNGMADAPLTVHLVAGESFECAPDATTCTGAGGL